MVVLDDITLPVARKAPTPVVEHQHVVGEHMAEPAVQTALGEVDLLTVSGREREIEISHQLHALRRISMQCPIAVGSRGRIRSDRERTAPAASSKFHSEGKRGVGRRSGTETRLPWLVSAVAVATRLSEYAASRSPSSHPSATTQSEFRTTRSAGAAAANAPLTLAGNPTLRGCRR